MLHAIQDFVESIITFFGDNIWLALLIAPIMGILMSFVPCCLAQSGIAVRCVQGERARHRVVNSLYFALGGAIVFAVVAVIVWGIGQSMYDLHWLYHVLLGFLVVLAVVWALFFDRRHKAHNTANHTVQYNSTAVISSGLSGSKDDKELARDIDDCECHVHRHGVATTRPRVVAHGAAGAFFAFPCSIPIMLAMLAFASYANNAAVGLAMIALYIVGHSILPFVAGVSAKSLFKNSKRGQQVFMTIKILLLLVMLAFAVLMIIEGLVEYFNPHYHDHDHHH